MNAELNNAWMKLERSKEHFLGLLNAWSAERLAERPNNGWSALQVVEHLITSENGTLEYLRKKTLAPPEALPEAGDKEAETSRKLNLALKSEHRWEAPPILASPGGGYSLEQLLTTWGNLREDWSAFLHDLGDDYNHKVLFRHPLAGYLSLMQTLAFLDHHIEHHVHQIRRIVKPA